MNLKTNPLAKIIVFYFLSLSTILNSQITIGDCTSGGAAVSGGYSDANDANTNWSAGLETFSPAASNEQVTTYHTVNSGTTGAVGFVVSTGSRNLTNQACIDDNNRSVVLYAVGDCNGTPILPTTDSPGANYSNYEFTGLNPSTNYILVVTIDPVSDCDVEDLAVTYYSISVNNASCDCSTPNCPASLTPDPTSPTFSDCQSWPGDETNSTIISYHTLTSSTDGTLGILQQLQPTSCQLTDADMQTSLSNRRVTLYAIGDCNGTPITATTANAGNSSTINPEWQGLTPNTQYIIKVEVDLLSCDINGTCIDYYYPPAVNCNTNAGTITVDINGNNTTGTDIHIPEGETGTFTSSGYTLPNNGTGTAGMALVAFSCPPTTGIVSPFDVQSDPCYLGSLFGDVNSTPNDGTGTSGVYDDIYVVYMTFDAASNS